MTTEPRMIYHLVAAFGDTLLQQITREQMQTFLNDKALTSWRRTIDDLRWDLKSIFKMAQSEGFVPFNPAAALFTPACQRKGRNEC